jgi:alanyl-tRNA synthetase
LSGHGRVERTPFYAESGGQIGDSGTIETETGRVEVVDTTYALPELTRHHGRLVEGTVETGQVARTAIDDVRRAAIRRSHTATHLVHWALREVLGGHVKQQGSLVAPDRLRFDFSHFQPVTPAELARIENLTNAQILANEPVRHVERTRSEAEEMGAIAFFGDKYGDVVRVLEAGPDSIELCGGTHVSATGDIGLVKIVSEGSIGSNLRRIEAVTGAAPVEMLRADEAIRSQAAELLGVTADDLVAGVERRLAELKALRDDIDRLKAAAASDRAGELTARAVDGLLVARVDGTGRDDLRDLAVTLRDDPTIDAVVLGGEPEGGGVALVAAVTPASDLHAGDLIADAASLVQGGGGRAPDLAVAGGRDVTRLDEALDLVRAAALGE